MMPRAIWENKLDEAKVSLLQITGTKDDAIPMNLNNTANDRTGPAIEDVVEYFVSTQELNIEEVTDLTDSTSIYKYSSDKNDNQVWHTLIKGGHHGWQIEKYNGFNANDLILEFFNEIIKNESH